MKINCLGCGHTIDLDETYSDYEGQVKCYTCSALLNKAGGKPCQVCQIPPTDTQRRRRNITLNVIPAHPIVIPAEAGIQGGAFSH